MRRSKSIARRRKATWSASSRYSRRWENPSAWTCDAIIGILEESKEIMEDYAGDSALDAGLAASAQAVEHYEIARYGTTTRTWADELGMKDASEAARSDAAGRNQDRPAADEARDVRGQSRAA